MKTALLGIPLHQLSSCVMCTKCCKELRCLLQSFSKLICFDEKSRWQSTEGFQHRTQQMGESFSSGRNSMRNSLDFAPKFSCGGDSIFVVFTFSTVPRSKKGQHEMGPMEPDRGHICGNSARSWWSNVQEGRARDTWNPFAEVCTLQGEFSQKIAADYAWFANCEWS